MNALKIFSSPAFFSRCATVCATIINRRYVRGSKNYSTGIADLDGFLREGIFPGSLVIIAGRPSMGKSALGLQLAEHQAQRGRSVLIHSLVMSRDEITVRAVTRNTGIALHRLNKKLLSSDDLPLVADALDSFNELPILIDDRSDQSLDQLCENIRKTQAMLANTGRPPLGMVLVDTIKPIHPGEASHFMSEGDDVAQRLKALAVELDVVVVAIAHVNNSVELRYNNRPMLAAIEFNGDVQKYGDLVMMIYRGELYGHSESHGVAEIIISRNRYGALGTVPLSFDNEKMRFDNLSRDDDGQRASCTILPFNVG